MTELVWGEQDYETGISHVVFYPNTVAEESFPEGLPRAYGPGEAWNGVVSIGETTPTPTVTQHAVDGVKYLDFVSAKFFQGKLTAFSVPPSLEEYLGTVEVAPGYALTAQPRKRFHLCYRTEYSDGFQIHLLYNVLGSLTKKSYNTLAKSVAAPTYELTLSATPELAEGYKATAYVSFDSRRMSGPNLANLLAVLYGEDGVFGGPPARIRTLEVLLEEFA